METIRMTAFKVPYRVSKGFFSRVKERMDDEAGKKKFAYLICNMETAPEVCAFISGAFSLRKPFNLRSTSNRLDNTQMSSLGLLQIISALEKANLSFAYLFFDVKRILNFKSALFLHSIPRNEEGKLYSEQYIISTETSKDDAERIRNSFHVISYS